MFADRLFFASMVSFLVAGWLPVQAQQPADTGTKRYFPRHLVGFEEGNATTQSFAQDLAAVLGSKILSAKKNPVCCLWVEQWKPSPGESGYLLLLQQHGGLLLVTDDRAFQDAKKWLESLPRSDTGELMIPLGVKSTFEMMPVGATQTDK